MEASTLAHLHQRVEPTIKESFDGFVLVGYVTNKQGKRERVCLADGGGDAAIADGLRPFMMNGSMWASQEKASPPTPDEGLAGEPT